VADALNSNVFARLLDQSAEEAGGLAAQDAAGDAVNDGRLEAVLGICLNGTAEASSEALEAIAKPMETDPLSVAHHAPEAGDALVELRVELLEARETLRLAEVEQASQIGELDARAARLSFQAALQDGAQDQVDALRANRAALARQVAQADGALARAWPWSRRALLARRAAAHAAVAGWDRQHGRELADAERRVKGPTWADGAPASAMREAAARLRLVIVPQARLAGARGLQELRENEALLLKQIRELEAARAIARLQGLLLPEPEQQDTLSAPAAAGKR
jgi:hypothetical protein